jgi:hypothetical protein
MKVQIEDNLYLESDGMGFMIKKYGTPYTNKKGELIEPSSTEGNYTSVQSAMRGLVKMKVMESTATTLNELIESVDGIKKWIQEKVTI